MSEAAVAARIPVSAPAGRPSSLVDTRIVYCGDNIDQLRKLPDGCVDLIYIDPPFNSNRNYEVFWGETKEKRAFEDRHASTQAYIEYVRPRCVELARVLKKTGSFYYHCDWHAKLPKRDRSFTTGIRYSTTIVPFTTSIGSSASSLDRAAGERYSVCCGTKDARPA